MKPYSRILPIGIIFSFSCSREVRRRPILSTRKTAPELNYTLPEFDIVMPFHPTEFTQVNPSMNRILVRRALSLLDPQPGERIADFFCGLGNFTLPIARRGAHVIGYEGERGADKQGAGEFQA